MNASQVQDTFSMELVNQREQSKSHNDIMTRRMKNRERQRRYRARKRLEADQKKSSVSCIIEQSTSPVVEPQQNGVVSNYSARVHCRRDWKKDARRAHIFKDSEVSRNRSLITIPVFSSESQTLSFTPGTKAELSLQRESHPDISLDLRTIPGRRDWKADARKKKN
ncbi:FAM50A-like protein [Trema orientale]|uniref:FAM50A-like protein n=1 Tax=Trema orientale TaxID=63057 RepID=A0A2P5EPG7_TREOI|nr:FAM50A-like protein [Trema orientale]